MADITNRAYKKTVPSTFDPTSFTKGFQEYEDRERKQAQEDEMMELRRKEAEQSAELRRAQIDNYNALTEYRKSQIKEVYNEKYKTDPVILDPTNFGSVNEVANRAVDMLNDQLYEVNTQLRDGVGDRRALEKRKYKIHKSLKQLQVGYEQIKGISDELTTRMANGTLSGLDREMVKDIERFQRGQVSVQLGANDEVVYVIHDEQGNPTNFYDVQELINGSVEFSDPITAQDLGKTLAEGVETFTYKDAGTLEESLSVNERGRITIAGRIQEAILDDNVVAQVLYNAGKNLTHQRTGFTQEQRDDAAKLIEDNVYSNIKMGYTKGKEDPDAPDMNVPQTTVTNLSGADIITVNDIQGNESKFIPNQQLNLPAAIELPSGEMVDSFFVDSKGNIVIGIQGVGETSVKDDSVSDETTTTKSKYATRSFLKDRTLADFVARKMPHPTENRPFYNVDELIQVTTGQAPFD